MDFLVLGPLEVSDGARTLALGGRRQQMVLGALLLHANRPVSADRLIDIVWGEAPPKTARKTLQVYVSRLRSVLGDGALVSADSGYVLTVDPHLIDAARFEALAEEGHRSLPSDPVSASRTLRQAIALWRGLPWGELGTEEAFRPEAERLRELRLTALEDRIEADAALGYSAQLVGELRGLVAQHPWRERLCAQLMLSLYRSGRQAEALAAYQDIRRALGEELGIEPSPELQRLEEQILLHDPEIAVMPAEPSVPLSTTGRNPFKGLRPFSEEDADDFFGRAGLVERLIGRLAREPFVAVVGASGSGKSSLIRAGLIPALRSGVLPGSRQWPVVSMRPGPHPFGALAAAVDQVSAPGLMGQVSVGDDLDLLRASSTIASSGTRFVLVIDQFEELVTVTEDEGERTRFVRNIVEAVTDPSSMISVVIGLRADYLDRSLELPELGELLADKIFSVLPLTASEIEAAAVRPARAVGIAVEPELVAELIAVTARQPGVLPLFQYVLTELCDASASGVLSMAGYRELGGLQGALSRRADETYLQLDEEQRKACRQLMLRMVVFDGGGRPTQRRVLRSELEALDLGEASIDALLDSFGEARLLTFDRDVTTGLPTVELAHEALLREWPTLRDWISDAADHLRSHRSLEIATQEWESALRDSDYLLAGSRLELYRELQAQGAIKLAAREQEYLDASTAGAEEGRVAELARRQKELRLERRAVKRLRWLVAAVSVAALVAVALTVFATGESRRAEANAREARARELASAAMAALEDDPELSLLLALAATDVSTAGVLPEVENALHAAMGAHRVPLVLPKGTDVAYLPSGLLLVGGDPPWVFDPADGSSVSALDDVGGPMLSIAATPDGSRVAFGSSEGPVSVWDASGIATGVLHRRWAGAHGGAVTGLRFSPDGRLLASVSPVDRTVRIWDAEGGDLLEQIAEPEVGLWDVEGPLLRVAFDPDGRRIAVTGARDGTVRIYDLESGEWTLTLSGHAPVAIGVEFSSDGTRVVTGAYDGTARVWDAESGRELGSIESSVGQVIGLDVSRDGSMLVVGGSSGLVEIWEPADVNARRVATLRGHQGTVAWVGFDATGSSLATSGNREAVRIWNVDAAGGGEWASFDGRTAVFGPDGSILAIGGPGRDVTIVNAQTWAPITVLPDAAPFVAERDAEAWVVGIAVSPDGSMVATAGHSFGRGEGRVQLWDAATGRLIRTLSDATEPRGSIAFSPDGTRLAAALCTGGSPANVWAVANGELVFSAPASGCGHAVDFGPGGTVLAVQVEGTVDNVLVWDVDTGRAAPASISHLPAFIGSVEFDSVGDRLLTAGSDGRARVWHVGSGDSVMRFEDHDGAVEQAVWSPDEAWIATGDSGGTVRVWNAITGDLRLRLEGHSGMVVGLSYGAGGRRLVSTDDRGSVRVWAIDLDDLVRLGRDRLTRGMSAAECATYHFDDCPAP